ncbi:tRNA (adenosine(37)-N6)-threonylcarbamoyltransferase complex dimerization subunit type 1 TsaB [Pseudorhodobacter sp.]|uniref:tRNA (adenosine(37)-N6)-threonylcarbamoyltransferase complex dimerization subunit type 1 TsaB n=1 Tax=Pseudorhodobacter sp. TaxID=1934400 RepID=UPI002AFFCF1C|nr:tRNA (adenosine(37)-N6)-threonylcarbamoyltransferase complex dimerization subunit type 1 TsaB [Pseudorhodobacter sp.]
MPSDKPLLAFDTSAAHCAAALLLQGDIIAETREEMAKGQAERLMPMIEAMLAGAGYHWRDLGALAVGVGPGNFTGIRISVAAARGLALGLGVPAVGVTGLEALAFCGSAVGLGQMRAATPAARNALYVQDFNADIALSAVSEARPDDPDFWPGTDCALLGDWPETAADQTRCILRPDAMARLRALAHIGAKRAHTGAPLPAPFYLRAPDAAPPSDPPPVILDEDGP